MPRISRDEVAVREQFALELFAQNPGLPIKQANEIIKQKFNSNMRAQRLYDLRKAAASAQKPESEDRLVEREVQEGEVIRTKATNDPLVVVITVPDKSDVTAIKKAIKIIREAEFTIVPRR